ncbi:MAG: polymer-forming cytoskeletal protein [Bacteroidetes bacterium]|nr:polymer-forming cytoskeletal protein [Bacteroidota bacterium]MDA0874416.1 polymer-forming cytoskeletal protein [Bacteroidota bacterium]
MARNDSSASPPTQINLIAAGTTLEGTISTKDDIRVSGQLKGTLKVEGKAIIAQEGQVEGEVFAVDADVAGFLKGEITIKERLVLKSTARIEGSIKTTRLIVEEGAIIDGTCRMGQLDPKRAEALKAGDGANTAPKQAQPSKQGTFSMLTGD